MLAAVLCAGCKTVTYNPSYTRPVTMKITPRYSGKLLLYTTSAEDKFVFHGHSKSFTGIAWDLKVPLGKMSKEMAGDIYGHLFEAGYEFGSQVDTNSGYALILHPKIEDFAWRMNQAKNLGFAITPQVMMTLDVQLLSPGENKVIFQRQYESGWVDGNSYVVNITPFEAVNVAIHKTMANLMVDSIRDLDALMQPNSPQMQPQPPSFGTRDEGMASVIGFWSAWSQEMSALDSFHPFYGQPYPYWQTSTPKTSGSVYTEPHFIETYISDNFEGWTGNTIWKMDNGQVWQQAEYSYHYHYAYHPQVFIFPSNGEWFMRVEGDDGQIKVQRLK